MSTKGSGGRAGRVGGQASKPIEPSKKPPAPADLSELLRGLASKANTGDPLALAGLRRLLDDRPEVWQTLGDLGRRAERCWVDLLAGGDALSAESIKKFLHELKEELLGLHPTAVERLLVDDVAVSYLAARHAETLAAQPDSQPVAVAALRVRRSESAQRRLHRALANLVLLRAKAPEGMAAPNSLRLFTGETKQRRRA